MMSWRRLQAACAVVGSANAQIVIGQTVGVTGPVAATVREAVEGARLLIDSVDFADLSIIGSDGRFRR